MNTRIAGLLVFAAIGIGLAAAARHDGRPQEEPVGARLVLSPEQQLEIAPALAHQDSFSVVFTVAVPAAQKFQRHRCVISGNRKFDLKTAPLRRWALRGDTLTVLSELQLTLRARADSRQPLVLKFDFENLDVKPSARGTATLKVTPEAPAHALAQKAKTETPAPAGVAASATKTDTAAKAIKGLAAAAFSTTKNAAVKKDTAAVSATVASDSATAQVQPQPDLDTISENAAKQEQGWLWMLIALLLLGISLIALVSVTRKAKTRAGTGKTRSRLEPMAAPVVNHMPAVSHAATTAAKSEIAPETKPFTATHVEGAREIPPEKATLPIAPAAVPAIDLFAEERMPLVTPAALQSALSKLRDITTQTQNALAVQYQALEQFSRHTQSVRGFLLENTAPQESDAARGEASRSPSPRNGQGRASSENKPAEISLRVLPAEEKGEELEEVASAIDGLIAASATKPLASPPAVMPQKAEALRRISSGLQELSGICRVLALSAPLTNVENLTRKVLDLQVSCEAWLADQSVKLSFSLPRAPQEENPVVAGPARARREIVDSIVDSLYETRKIAVQGPIYFERRVTQLLEYDLPKLRQQFKEIENEKMRRVWEGMGV